MQLTKEVIRHKLLYAISIFLLISSYYHLSFTWIIQKEIVCAIVTIISMIFYQENNKLFCKNEGWKIILVLILWYLYPVFFISKTPIVTFFFNVLIAIPTIIIVFLPVQVKRYLFDKISLFTTIILAVSLVGWILYLIGVNLPSYTVKEYDDGYHDIENYYFFIVNLNTLNDIPRFAGMFLEPGQMASVVTFLLMGNIILKGRKSDIIIQLLSIFFSFSLAGWMVLLILYPIYYIFKNKKNYKILFLPFFVLLAFYYVSNISEKSNINRLIINRLAFDEDLGIAGNNRTSEYFDARFKVFMKSENRLLGVHNELKDNDWTIGNSGWKLYIVHYGIVGFAIMLLLNYQVYLNYKSRFSIIIFAAYIILGIIRSLWLNPYWFYIIICTMHVIQKVDLKMIKSQKSN